MDWIFLICAIIVFIISGFTLIARWTENTKKQIWTNFKVWIRQRFCGTMFGHEIELCGSLRNLDDKIIFCTYKCNICGRRWNRNVETGKLLRLIKQRR